ncbi:DegV family protein [Candidatus Formimonas warabiya]|uniref:Fatty acid-binding protein DegV n=1 Tax=Formimonas warabiya TaxID=1761012 RepID=A0A3G1KWF3_FORW1|nr:DegV family protein [Candidatus Formimonas warabiya]ATW26873.1 fatty acid-binding protein DegV [Candidatus Formimonas warabiya]
MLQIITDSSSDLPPELIKKHHIHVVPLTVYMDGQEYTEGVTIKPRDFAEKMIHSPVLPRTSQPSPGAFAQLFQEISPLGPLLCLTLSSKLSGTYLSACQGKDISRKDVAVFDTLSGSLGHGIQILKTVELAAQGLSREEIVKKLTLFRSEMNIFILLDTLENIVKGGRLNRFTGALAKILDIKVLAQGVEGAVEVVEKIRGKKRFLQKVVETITQSRRDFSDRLLGITHVDNWEDAKYLKEALMEKVHPKEVLLNEMGPTMGTYAGKGGIIIAV